MDSWVKRREREHSARFACVALVSSSYLPLSLPAQENGREIRRADEGRTLFFPSAAPQPVLKEMSTRMYPYIYSLRGTHFLFLRLLVLRRPRREREREREREPACDLTPNAFPRSGLPVCEFQLQFRKYGRILLIQVLDCGLNLRKKRKIVRALSSKFRVFFFFSCFLIGWIH